MADDLQQGAVGGLSDLCGKFVPFLFEGGKLDLYQFVQGQFAFDAFQKSLSHAVVPNFEDGFKSLRIAFEAAAVSGCQCRLQAHKMACPAQELKNGKKPISEPWFI